MAHPIIIQDSSLRNYLANFRAVIRPAQWRYFETVLMGLIHCQASRTLSGMLRPLAVFVTVWQLSRFLVSPRWSTLKLAQARYTSFCAEVQPLVAAAHASQHVKRSGKQGRPKATVVTGYLIFDDSTHVKRYAQTMGGLGRHYSSADQRPMPGHSLFQGVYLLEGHQYPLEPQMYIQKAVCEQAGLPFRSKVNMTLQAVEHFAPLADTHTQVLVDSWYLNKALWKVVKQRGWDLSGGLKANHKLYVLDPTLARFTWMRLDDFASVLSAEPFEPVGWPSQAGEQRVWACLIRTRIKKLGACQLLLVRPTADAPVSQTRFYLTTRLEETLEQVVATLALRWTVETLFADFKELLGSDQYQLHSGEAIRRFWALGLCMYQYLASLRLRLEKLRKHHVTLGETLAWLRQRHDDLALDWACALCAQGIPRQQILAEFAPALKPFALSNC
jgi:hypothetical protein